MKAADGGLVETRPLPGRAPARRAWAARIGSRPLVVLLPLLVVLVAVTLRFPSFPSDEPHYVELAHNLTEGRYTGLGWRSALPDLSPDRASPDLWFGPGLPLALAPLAALEAPLVVMRLTGPLFLFLAALVFFHLLHLFVGRRVAFAGAYALGLYPPFYTVLTALHSEPLAILLVVVALYALAKALRSGGLSYLLLGGAALAGLALTRVAFGWVLTGLLVASLAWWALSRRSAPRRLAFVCGLGLALCIPWLVFTFSVTGRPFLWGNSGSMSLYWMTSTSPGDLGDWQGAFDVFAKEELAPHREVFRELQALAPVEQNRALERIALANIRDDPLNYAENVAANMSRMWFNMPFSYVDESLTTLYYVVPNSLLLWLLVASTVVLVRRRRSLPVVVVPYALFALVAFGLHALVAAYPRMLMPIVPILLWLILYAFASHVRVRLVERRSGP